MSENWIVSETNEAWRVALAGVATYAAVLLSTRLVGLRSLSKMSAADFVITVAVGSLFASTIALATPTRSCTAGDSPQHESQ